jgi:DNA-binding ferritin-like protein
MTFNNFNKDDSNTIIIKVSTGDCHAQVAQMVSELMNAATSFHKLHLKINGMGSYAAHTALNDLYDALPGHADALAEGYQGAAEHLLSYEEESPKSLNSINEALGYCNQLKEMINELQKVLEYSEVINDLDNVKSTINSVKYKLLFLK